MYSSTFILIATNAVAIIVAMIEGWDLGELLWIYWAQSMIIGFYQARRMMALQRFSTKDFTSNGKPVPETPEGKRSTVVFFAIHYGFFHVIYLVFLFALAGLRLTGLGWLLFAAAILGFAFNHHYSFVANRERDRSRVPNIGRMMFFPYLRILPMHLTIILGFHFAEHGDGFNYGLLLFLILKTLSDVMMHVIEHGGKLSDPAKTRAAS